MKKIVISLICMLIVIPVFSNSEAEAPGKYDPPLIGSSAYIDYEIDVLDQEAPEAIRAINRRNIEKDLFNKIDNIFDDYERKYYFEAHIGFACSLNNGIHKEEKIINEEPTEYDVFVAPGMLFRFNLFNPKIYNSKKILDDISIIKGLSAYYNIELPIDILRKLLIIENKLLKYEREVFFKRISVGIGLPFKFSPGENGQFEDFLVTGETFGFVGYDIMDLFSVFGGFNLVDFDDYYLGISMDISSPIINATSDFLNYLMRLLKIK